MRADPESLRAALESYLADDARARLAHNRGDPAAPDPARVVARHARLSSHEVASLLTTLRERGSVSEREAELLAGHLRRHARATVLASIRRTSRALSTRLVEVRGHGLPFRVAVTDLFGKLAPDARRARIEAIEAIARSAAPVIRERWAEAEAAAAALPLDFAAPVAPPRELAEALLHETQDLRDEALDFLAHRGHELRDVWGLLPALRAQDLDDVLPRPERLSRYGALARSLGVDRELAQSTRIDAPHGAADPRTGLLVLSAPNKLRLAPSFAELGLVTELETAHAVGRAAALCLAHVALPIERRYPLDATVARSVGSLFAQWAVDGSRLHAFRRTPAATVDAARRVAALVDLLSLRLDAAAITLPVGASHEEAADALYRALGLPCTEPTVASLALLPTPSRAARLRGRLGGLALWNDLRDRFDVDWYANPRARDVLRGAAGQGEGVTIEAWLAELGLTPAAGIERLAEWFRG